MHLLSQRLISLVAAAVVTIVPAQRAAADTAKDLSPAVARSVDALIAIAMRDQHLPGVSLAIARNGRVLYARGYGYSDLTSKRAADELTIYNIGSVSKQFTATAIMLLQQNGKLTIDKPIAAFFPGYSFARQITIRDLLNQTSGIPDYSDDPNLVHHATALQFFQTVWKRPLDFTPGTRFEYSNTNYVALGIIVERASGMSYSNFLAHHVFAPAGMAHATTHIEPRELSRGATGYTDDGASPQFQPVQGDDYGYGDGDVDANVLDLIRWDAALDDGRLVSTRSFHQMTTPPHASFEDARGGYGFGLGITQLYGRKMIVHTGANPGFVSINATFPYDGLEVAIISNSDAFNPTLLFRRIVETIERPSAEQVTRQDASYPGEIPAIRALAATWLTRLQTGKIDALQLTPHAAQAMKPTNVQAMALRAGAVGKPRTLVYRGASFRRGEYNYTYVARFAHAVVTYNLFIDTRGKIDGMMLAQQDPALLAH